MDLFVVKINHIHSTAYRLIILVVNFNVHIGLFCLIVTVTWVSRLCITAYDIRNYIQWWISSWLNLWNTIQYLYNIFMISFWVFSNFFSKSISFHATSLINILFTNMLQLTKIFHFLLQTWHLDSTSALWKFTYPDQAWST